MSNNPPLSPQGANLQRGVTQLRHQGFILTDASDASAARERPGGSFVSALLATALFRCWHLLIFFTAWATLISLLNYNHIPANFKPTILTVIGTVLGFVISYRTTSSFERYNEGRRYWSTIIVATRTFARTIWFHIPDTYPPVTDQAEAKRRATIEKKTMINLIEAFAVAVKHYLRGEDGIYYSDLYYLVKFLPAYALPTGIPPHPDVGSAKFAADPAEAEKAPSSGGLESRQQSFLYQRSNPSVAKSIEAGDGGLPLPATSPNGKGFNANDQLRPSPQICPVGSKTQLGVERSDKTILPRADEQYLLPANMPPKYHIFDLFPFSLIVKLLTKRGKSIKGKKAARLRAKMKNKGVSHNLPLEISLYMSSYIASLQQRKVIDVPTTNTLLNSLNMLVDSLTGLERILTTPIPFSYSIHLWVVAIIYCLALPLQMWNDLRWVTIPATSVASFIFFGFLVAGEEIENPFGYDRNDLNLDHFTHNVIHSELVAITSSPPPDPSIWAFAAENDCLFSSDYAKDERVTPDEWLKRSVADMYPSTKA